MAAGAPGASSAHVVSGAYQSEVSNSAFSGAVNGRWRLTLRGGTYTFRFTGHILKKVILTGRYSLMGRRITFHEKTAACSSQRASGGCAALLRCRGAGVYRVNLSGRELNFVKVSDPQCASRRIVLSGGFHRRA
jgi:hypothetical protein